MSHNHMIRLAPLSDSDPLAARLAYYAYHGLRAIQDVVAEQGYVLSDYLVDLFDNQARGLSLLSSRWWCWCRAFNSNGWPVSEMS
jgi:hypothetical protein